MGKNIKQTSAEEDLKQLEYRVDELIRANDRLMEENRSLRLRQDLLVGERAKLIEKNELVRNRVESMINRLKGMEQSA